MPDESKIKVGVNAWKRACRQGRAKGDVQFSRIGDQHYRAVQWVDGRARWVPLAEWRDGYALIDGRIGAIYLGHLIG